MQLHQWHLKCSLSCISYVHRIRPGGCGVLLLETQPKLHFLRTSHPRQRISHAMCCSYSLITVTSSYRIFTCFPFTLCIQAHISHAKRLYMTGTNDLLYETFYILAYCAFIYNAKIASDFRCLQ